MQTPNDSEKLFHYKRQVAQRFDRAALTYDAYADFQRLVLDRLFSHLPSSYCADTVLDVGTGTGQALPTLLETHSPSLLVAFDLSLQMLEQAGESAQPVALVCGDAEALPFAEAGFDLLFSSLAMQWCLQPEALFAELYRVTKPGGYLVFSTLCEGSMPEISKAWQGIDHAPHVNHYPSFNDLLKQLGTSPWQTVNAELETVPMWFESPEEAIYSLKKVGASLVVSNQKNAISPSKWKAFIQQYEQLRENSGIPLRYQVAFVVLQKPCF
ncbi:malonyl-ACP O-methyltransferase BioC [Marinomonas pollencensis]|uniref:Malonyl-[acyl-carrier protein] O-methyltransferase n=1 Tax=Marinomonas pollencensis TaxID=491954 RepID=A0A3E0DLE7_9GAMM|nr:malonyl-ACP O-methyltransferase BioC [Marinomonas pollencensis]REG82921.1 pimeloyl-CoA biosynthesis protein BioC [Marinomonas pollencensis]